MDDRITVEFSASDGLKIAIEKFRDLIMAETLSTSLAETKVGGAGVQGFEFDEQWLKLSLIR